jgi:hypothetical protein
MSSPPTGAPQRNFDLPVEVRVRALVSGAPAFARRLRAIEDLEETIVRMLVKKRDRFPGASYAKLEGLVAAHNRYYPIEANLPASLRTGELMDRDGRPWRPRACPSMEELRARADKPAAFTPR